MNTEIIKVARKAAAHYKNSDGYAQAAEIITMLCDELEKTQRPVAPPTVKDVLLKTWAQDTEAMAAYLTDLSLDEGIYYFLEIQILDNGMYESYKGTITRTEAFDGWVVYLNSAAEVGK